jgi:hypothetical protein
MTTTSGYSGRLGGRSGHYVPDQTQTVRLLGYREAQKRTVREVAADGPNDTVHDDERQTVYDVHLEVLMG